MADELDRRMKEEAARHNLGATGRYPAGKCRDDDEGELKVGVASVNGRVAINFGKPVSWVSLTPDEARRFAEVLVKRAREVEEANRG